MNGYLLDTNVVSTSSPLKRGAGDADVRRWLLANSEHLFLSVVSIAEVRAGVERAGRLGQARKAAVLDAWLRDLVAVYDGRILPLDLAVAGEFGRLFDLALGKGWSPGWIDAEIAATASVHGLTVVTRNAKHFLPMEVEVLDPFAASGQHELP